jgi:Protein of unknown function (DUF2877)
VTGTRQQSALSIGAAVQELIDLATATSDRSIVGTIVGTFSSGCYVRCGEALFAIGDIPAGPLHVVVAGRCCRHIEGQRVNVSASSIRLGDADYTMLLGATSWSPILPPLATAHGACQSLEQLPDECPHELAGVWPETCVASRNGDLDMARRLLEGRGSGTTPSGDDLLAGLLLADAMLRRSVTATNDRIAIAQAVKSTDLSRAFLYWAARGQTIEPLHDVLDRAAAANVQAMSQAAARVRAIGSSSGTTLLAGLRLGMSGADATDRR